MRTWKEGVFVTLLLGGLALALAVTAFYAVGSPAEDGRLTVFEFIRICIAGSIGLLALQSALMAFVAIQETIEIILEPTA